jgi:SAM-dependent methyltransferase
MIKETVIKILGSHKIKLSGGMLKLAACFVDYEAEYLPPDSRIVEYGFAFSKLMGLPQGKVCDVGYVARHNYIIPSLAFYGWQVTGIDIRKEWSFHHPNFKSIQGDMRTSGLPDSEFDVVICISTLEHIGLSGYYGITELDNDGDMSAVNDMKRVLKQGGKFILTVPYCKDYSVTAGARIYDMARLNKILDGFSLKSIVVYLQVGTEWLMVDTNIAKEGVVCLEAIKR